MYTVMVVEDEYLVRTGIKSIISDSGLPLSLSGVAADGSEAYKMICETPPDILLADLRLPGMDGIRLFRRMRRNNVGSKILVVTCLEDYETQREANSYGISGYLFKATMTTEELTKALENVIRELDSGTDKPQVRPEIKLVLNYIDTHLNEALHLQMMAEIAGFSQNYFSNLFTQEVGINYVAYVNNIRLVRAAEMLKNKKHSVSDVALFCGFNDESYFSRCFKQKYGQSPGKWRRGFV